MCVARLVALHRSATALPSEEAVRWAFASQLLHEVEQLGPGDFDDADEERATLELAVECALRALRRWLPASRLGVVAAESARFLEELGARGPALPDVPMRRIATTREVARLWRALETRWPKGSGVVLGRSIAYGGLRDVLLERGIPVVWMLHPMTPALSMLVDTHLLGTRADAGAPAWFPPMPAYVVDETFDWFAYVDDGGEGVDRVGGFLEGEELSARIAPR